MIRLRSIAAVGCAAPVIVAALAYLYDPPWIGGMTTGLGRWEEYPAGIRYRWTTGHATLYVPSDATSLTLPMRAGFQGTLTRAVTVKVSVDDRWLADVVLPEPAAWFRTELPMPHLRTHRRHRRIDLLVDRTVGEMSLGVQTGEISVKGSSAPELPLPGALLVATDVAAGTYRVRVTRKSSDRGELTLGIGRAALPIGRWPLSDALLDEYTFRLPVRAAAVVVKGDSSAVRSIDRVALVPDPPDGITPEEARASDAAQYGDVVVYALDDRVWLEHDGFWVMGDRRPDVVISAKHPVTFVDLIVHNRPVSNTVRVRSGQWFVERALEPDEAWRVRVPLPKPAQDLTVGFDVARGVRPADVDPASRDHRSLGCWVEVQ
jgi:hypothetical protein